jgi:NADH:ubiquinone reductase (H+-translocating)
METKNIVIVVGCGAGGLELGVSLAKKYLKNKEFKVILVDKEKTHIWKPNLHEVAAGKIDYHNEQVD